MPDHKPKLLDEYPLPEAASLLLDAATETVLGSSLGIGFKLASTVASKVQQRRAERVYQDILLSWASTAGMSPQDFQVVMWARAEDGEAFQDRLYDTFRSIANAKNSAAYPYIAKLTAPYALEDLEPDEFFRRAAWLLERCEAADIGALKATLETSRGFLAERSAIRDSMGIKWSSPLLGEIKVQVAKDREGGSLGSMYLAGAAAFRTKTLPEHRIFSLLDESGLAEHSYPYLCFATADGHLDRLIELFTGPLPL